MAKAYQEQFENASIRRAGSEISNIPARDPALVLASSYLTQYVCKPVQGDAHWLHKPDVPTQEEIGAIKNGRLESEPVTLTANQAVGGWQSIEAYLAAHYNLFRQDAVNPLRDAVSEIREYPWLVERESNEHSRIYENVYITGITAARDGLAIKVEFSTRRSEKKIRWAQSKRLKTGTIVALTPVLNKFSSICIVAVVASRPLSTVDVDYPEKPRVQLYLGNPDELEIDPQQEFLMVEASNGYWESTRHILKALQKMADESFPLFEHIVSVQPDVDVTEFCRNEPIMDLTPALNDPSYQKFEVNVLDRWPEFKQPSISGETLDEPPSDDELSSQPLSALDQTQLEALRRMLTKRLAIVQGPPGTGKTFVSVLALRILLSKLSPADPPLIVVAHTNHALDQLLRHIHKFEPRFVRLGGQTTDEEVILPRTLFNVREQQLVRPSLGLRAARKAQRDLGTELETILAAITTGEPLSPDLLFSFNLISEVQRDSFQNVTSDWVGGFNDEKDHVMHVYCQHMIQPAVKNKGYYSGTQYEEYDENEKLEEENLEIGNRDDDRYEVLRGRTFDFETGFVASDEAQVYNESVIAGVLQDHEDVNEIPFKYRGAVYSYLQKKLKTRIRDKIRKLGKEAQRLADDLKVGRWETDYEVLRRARIIGMTTTGLSKYRGLVSALKPMIVMIEEAAETLEGFTSTACMESLEQLILVGDHQQLQGHVNCSEFEGHPYYLNMSMFERLINNGLEYTQLQMQRRMRPEIREILNPIYPMLGDHVSVLDREDVPGMGGVNCHFFNHEWREHNDDALSKQNELEARLVVSFYEYLVLNGTPIRDITILTFYNGQRRLILKILSLNRSLQGFRHKVVTVDSYQGEENNIVLLSLVRNNNTGNIGFLASMNRACVALSRARLGFYLFGFAGMLAERVDEWKNILVLMLQAERIGNTLPVTCKNHGTVTEIASPAELEANNAGCHVKCGAKLSCGHMCPLKCHPFPHDEVSCDESCENRMRCGHMCGEECSVRPCRCTICTVARQPSLSSQGDGRPSSTPHRRGEIPQTEDGKAFREFANSGHVKEAARLNAMNQELHDGGLSLLAMQVEKKAVIDDDESLMEFSDDDNNNANNAESSGKKNVSVESPKENVEPLIDFGEERGGKVELSESTWNGARFYNPGPSGTSVQRTKDGKMKIKEVYTSTARFGA